MIGIYMLEHQAQVIYFEGIPFPPLNGSFV